MGRTSDYTKQVRNEECENTVETKKSSKSFADIKRMFAKEPMTAEQFGIYLGECKAAGDFISDAYLVLLVSLFLPMNWRFV